jgi:putative DNA primase/helicase
MATLFLPADTVRFYNDGPEAPQTPELQLAEWHYRQAFLAGAREVASWSVPNVFALAQIWDERAEARRAAEVRVASSILFGHPHLDSEQIVYRVGHEVAASQTRGRCQALEMAKQLWWELGDAGLGDQQIRDSIMKPWLNAVVVWAGRVIDPRRVDPPPRPEDFLTGDQRRMLEAAKEAPKPPAAKATPTAMPTKPEAIIRRLTNVDRELLDWLWPGRIPLGKLTLLAGDPGLGKSFVTLDIAARVSRGAAWPDLPLLKQSPGGVVLFNAEDDLADTIAPRLDKAEADDRNILAVEGVTMMGQRRHFSLEQDLPRLAEVVEQNPGTRLVVIDPISAYTGKIDSHNNSDVRGLLAPLAELAGRYDLAIVAVTHLSKSGGTKAVYRAMGSLAFAAASRAVWAIVKDQADPQRRLFLPAKLNLAQDPDGLAYRIKEGRVVWETDPVRMHADDAFAAEMQAVVAKPRGTERRDAMEWLRDELAGGRRPSKEIIEYGKECGFSEKTLRRAYTEIGAKATKESFNGQWLWGLRNEDDQDGH